MQKKQYKRQETKCDFKEICNCIWRRIQRQVWEEAIFEEKNDRESPPQIMGDTQTADPRSSHEMQRQDPVRNIRLSGRLRSDFCLETTHFIRIRIQQRELLK